MQPMDGVRTRQQITDELRTRLKYVDPTTEPGRYFSDPFINGLAYDKFEPPIENSKQNPTNTETVIPVPNYPRYDPRSTGRIVKLGPKTIINPTLLHFLIHNAGKYGFVHYGPLDPSIWYWRADKTPYQYGPNEVVGWFSNELQYLL